MGLPSSRSMAAWTKSRSPTGTPPVITSMGGGGKAGAGAPALLGQLMSGCGVLSALGGSMGCSTLGCLPVRVERKPAIAVASASVSFMPSWADPMTATASESFQTLPEWK